MLEINWKALFPFTSSTDGKGGWSVWSCFISRSGIKQDSIDQNFLFNYKFHKCGKLWKNIILLFFLDSRNDILVFFRKILSNPFVSKILLQRILKLFWKNEEICWMYFVSVSLKIASMWNYFFFNNQKLATKVFKNLLINFVINVWWKCSETSNHLIVKKSEFSKYFKFLDFRLCLWTVSREICM